MNKIIVFANQKGGVGKTTLCIEYANYLASKNIPVLVIDCDNQQTISERRKTDIKKYGEDVFLYNVQPFSVSEIEKVDVLMQNLKKIDGVVLLDAPGNLSQQGLIPLFANSDYIICPYQYEVSSINSTVTFTVFIKGLEQRIESMSSTIFFLPNKCEAGVGTKEELELWKQTAEVFGKYGINTPKIPKRVELTRCNTVSNSKLITNIVQQSFDFIYSKIFKSQV